MHAGPNDDNMRREAKHTVREMSGYAWHDLVGNLGVLMILGTYFALQADRIDAKSVVYSALNALGAGSITVSLLFDFNLSAFVVEAAWVAVSVYGLARAFRRQESH
jgi:hypothetical protein